MYLKTRVFRYTCIEYVQLVIARADVWVVGRVDDITDYLQQSDNTFSKLSMLRIHCVGYNTIQYEKS